MRQFRLQVRVAAMILAATGAARADIIAIDPFDGALTDTFDQWNTNQAVLSLPVFGGFGALEVLSAGGAIKVEFSSTFLNDPVVPLSDMMAGQLGIAQWVFDTPLTRFGGWFENNSGASDATLEFYDASDTLIGTMIADIPVDAQTWTWNGWQSDVPFSRIVVTGNGVINGFIWYENMQADPVPAPAALTVIGGGLMLGTRRRRRDPR
ncbi:MAG: hypothetical protein KDA25_00180 [Phycisphaerales bacterium]|nr:hypothetical protein [Phycisphaerales bacterium]